MTFNSIEFLIFYPTVLLLYFLLPRTMKWPLLLLSSYFFYAYYSPSLVFLIFGTTLVSWLCATFIEKSKRVAVKRILLTVTLAVCLGVLFFYKYFDFVSASVASLFARDGFLLNLMLPVGISFYTFQTLSYVIDVYRGEVKTEKNFFFYALFVSFFPQLVAGPIERPSNLIPQLREEHNFTAENFKAGGKFMLLGFFKKICIADLVAPLVNAVFNDAGSATTLSIIIATVLFSLQIYCDFSGYTDIAIGAARIMGIRLMKNFDHPYRAETVKEFWSRWHISLSTWFRDYLYIPLGGNRVGRLRHLLNIFIVFLISGLWHGAAWTFVIWGALHGFYQIIGTLTYKKRNELLLKAGISHKNFLVRAFRITVTFTMVSFAWIFFRANSIGDVGTLFSRLFTVYAPIGEVFEALGLSVIKLLLIISSVAVLFILDNSVTYEGGDDGSDVMVVYGGSFAYVIWVILIVWLLLFSSDMISTFIYFAF